jgi:hypothetical protein
MWKSNSNSNASTDHAEVQYPTVLRAIRARASARKYGNGVPLEVLAEAVARLSYKGVDLSHLYAG